MKNSIDIINKAKNSKNIDELDIFANCFDYKVRRTVARNPYTSQITLKKLQQDPSMNVAYMANLNAKEKVQFKDNLSLENPCVVCEKDESTFHQVCNTCQNDSYTRIINGYSPFGKEKVKNFK